MGYTTINDPSAYFTITLYTGDGNDNRAITNSANSGNFQPDWLWYKERSSTSSHRVFDSSRGASKRLEPDVANAEATDTSNHKSFDSNGFTVGTSGSTNANGDTYVAWQWKANGGTTSTDTNGAVDSTVQANTTAGFSIVTWTSAGSTNVGHGLGVAPNLIIIKARNATENWLVSSDKIDWAKRIKLNSTDGSANSSAFGQAPTSSIFYCNPASSSYNYVAYCFAEKQGYSKFGIYKGNGNADGPFIYLGFKPSMVIGKKSSASGNSWWIMDNKRSEYNVIQNYLQPNASDAESTGSANLDFVSNGFKIRRTGGFINDSGEKYIYMAFAEQPLVSSSGVPATAR